MGEEKDVHADAEKFIRKSRVKECAMMDPL